MDVKEQAQRALQLALQHAEKVGIGVMALLAALGIWMYLSEGGFSAPQIGLGSPTPLPEAISDAAEFERANSQLLNPVADASARPDIQRALRRNPFQTLAAPSASDAARWVAEDLARARAARDAKDNERARRLVEGVLKIEPSNSEAAALRDEVDAALAASDEADAAAADPMMDPRLNPGMGPGLGGIPGEGTPR